MRIGEAAEMLGVSRESLWKWEKTGELLPARKTAYGTRYYAVADLLGTKNEAVTTLCYARVSSHDQKEDLERQHVALEAYCAAKGWRSETIKRPWIRHELSKERLAEAAELILRRKIRRLVITHKDRLLRFGAELVFALCEIQGVEIVIIHQGEQPSFEEELEQDVHEIITVFSARLYGARSKKHKWLMDDLKQSTEAGK